jgi:uncharacterized protein (DUF2147 family)
MKMKSILVAGALLLGAATMAHAGPLDGTWLSESGKTKIKMAPCGGNYCGTIVWVQGPETKDVKNPDASKRSRNLVGLQMVYDMTADGDGYKGSLYNYDDGGTYSGNLRPDGDKLLLKGCLVVHIGDLGCRTTTWTRTD